MVIPGVPMARWMSMYALLLFDEFVHVCGFVQ